MSAGLKRCVVAYATRDEQWLWNVEVPCDATVADVLNSARAQASPEVREAIPWDSAPLGIFGQPCVRTDVPLEGDRVELYRPLAADPKERRRQQVQSQRRAERSGGRRGK
jgi:putative ubiquitin-RnfH superfamily antitoxin RatB of RatAB toxin-antitoxin module